MAAHSEFHTSPARQASRRVLPRCLPTHLDVQGWSCTQDACRKYDEDGNDADVQGFRPLHGGSHLFHPVSQRFHPRKDLLVLKRILNLQLMTMIGPRVDVITNYFDLEVFAAKRAFPNSQGTPPILTAYTNSNTHTQSSHPPQHSHIIQL